MELMKRNKKSRAILIKKMRFANEYGHYVQSTFHHDESSVKQKREIDFQEGFALFIQTKRIFCCAHTSEYNVRMIVEASFYPSFCLY